MHVAHSLSQPIEQEESDMAFGNFWRGSERERYGSQREQDRNRDRWRTTGSSWRDDQRDRWPEDEQRYSPRDRDRDEYSSREYGGRAGRSVTSDWESTDPYGDRSRGYGGGGYGYGGERYRGQG